MAEDIFPVGPGETYTSIHQWLTDVDGGVIGTSGNDAVAEVTGPIVEAGTSPTVNSNPNNIAKVVIRSSGGPGVRRRVSFSSGPTVRLLRTQVITIPFELYDLEIDASGFDQVNGGGLVQLNGDTPCLIARCSFHNVVSALSRLGAIRRNVSGTSLLEVYSCQFYNYTTSLSTATQGNGFISNTSHNGPMIVDGCTFDEISSTDAANNIPCCAVWINSGVVDLTIRNTTVTRNTNNAGLSQSWAGNLGTVTNTTTATQDLLGTITGIDEMEFVNANGRDYTPASGSQIEDAGTDLGATGSAIDFNGFNRNTDPSRDPWDIGSIERAKVGPTPDPPVPYTQWQPSRLRACWTTPNGVDLKKSHTTDSYSGGNPTAVTDLKPSIADYATGNLKAGLTIGGDIKPSILKAT